MPGRSSSLPASVGRKRAWVDADDRVLSMSRQSELLGLSRSSYYCEPATQESPNSPKLIEQFVLGGRNHRCFEETKPLNVIYTPFQFNDGDTCTLKVAARCLGSATEPPPQGPIPAGDGIADSSRRFQTARRAPLGL